MFQHRYHKRALIPTIQRLVSKKQCSLVDMPHKTFISLMVRQEKERLIKSNHLSFGILKQRTYCIKADKVDSLVLGHIHILLKKTTTTYTNCSKQVRSVATLLLTISHSMLTQLMEVNHTLHSEEFPRILKIRSSGCHLSTRIRKEELNRTNILNGTFPLVKHTSN